MHKFKDMLGREWQVEISFDTIFRVRERVDGVDLMALKKSGPGGAEDLLARLDSEDELLLAVIYAVLQPQVKALELNERDFAAGFGGTVIDDAARALTAGLADFFRSHHRRIIHHALEKIETEKDKVAQEMLAAMDSPVVDQALEKVRLQAKERLLAELATAGSKPGS